MAHFYNKLQKRARIFRGLTGIDIKNFDRILQQVTKLWDRKVTQKYKRPGRYYKLPLADKLIMMLVYYRSYTTQLQIGVMFGLDESTVCRIIRRLEPIVARIVAIKKDRTLSYSDVRAMLIDATEQQIERPSTNQRTYYSGKKRQHTVKTEVRIDERGRILHVSKTAPGRTHDFKLHKKTDPLPRNIRIYADSGYQGLRKIRKMAATPYKKRRKRPLTQRQKRYNLILRKRQIYIEHTFARFKKFKILSDRYRNKLAGHNLKFNIVAGLVNINNGFGGAEFKAS